MNRASRRAEERRTDRETRRTARRLRRGTAAVAGTGLALAGTAGMLVGAAGPAGATCSSSANVFNTADTGVGTLRDQFADLCSGGFIFFNGVAGQTITLTSPITIDKFVTFEGGANNVTISGGGTNRVFALSSGLTGTGTIAFNNLTVTNGRITNNSGAGISMVCASTGIDVSLTGMTVTNNEPTAGSTGNGAGAFAQSCGAVTITDSTFRGNRTFTDTSGVSRGSGSGVSVVNSGVVTVTGSLFDHNTGGAALRTSSSTSLTVTNTSFTDNGASTESGAVMALYTPLSVTGGTFARNTSTATGGAIFTNYSTATVSGSYLHHNTAGVGGAIISLYGTSLTLTDVTAVSNTATTYAGGAVAVVGKSGTPTTLTVSGGSFTDNIAETSGGALSARIATVSVTGASFLRNDAYYYHGGAMEFLNADATVSTVTVADNEAYRHGGGIAFYDHEGGHQLTVSGSVLSGNVAKIANGGAISAIGYTPSSDASALTIANSTITGNSAPDAGAVLVQQGVSADILQSTITGNHSVGASTNDAVLLWGVDAGLYPAGVFYNDISGSIIAGNDAGVSVTTGQDLDGINSHARVTLEAALIGGYGTFDEFDADADTQTFVTVSDLHLGALADNGGPTKTMALGEGSIAIDAGPVPVASFTGNTTDQRGTGFDRVVNDQVDVGAFEVQPGLPPAPTALNLTALGGRSARLTWTAPVSGPTPTGYQIRCLPQGYPVDVGPGGPVVYVGATTTSVDIPDLVGATTYVCYVRARYGAQYFSWLGDSDEGPLSDPSNTLLVAATVPPVPGRVTASTPPQPSGQATAVGFVEPENRSGAAISRYDARCTSSNGGTTRTGSGAASPVGVGNLTKGRTYSCVVSAVNSVGPSAWSAASARVVVPAGPATNVRASTPTAGNRRTTVSFTVPDGGPTPARYWVECRTADGSSVLTGSKARSPVTVANLVRGKTYTCRVWAVFTGGATGPASAASNSIRVP